MIIWIATWAVAIIMSIVHIKAQASEIRIVFKAGIFMGAVMSILWAIVLTLGNLM